VFHFAADMIPEGTWSPLHLEIFTAMVDFPLSQQLQLCPLPAADPPVGEASGAGGPARSASGPGSFSQSLFGASSKDLRHTLSCFCKQLRCLVETWEGRGEGILETFLRQGLLLRWLRGLHLLELEAAGHVLMMAAVILDPDTFDTSAAGPSHSGACPVEPTLVAQVRLGGAMLNAKAWSVAWRFVTMSLHCGPCLFSITSEWWHVQDEFQLQPKLLELPFRTTHPHTPMMVLSCWGFLSSSTSGPSKRRLACSLLQLTCSHGPARLLHRVSAPSFADQG
jgi:hypothetical protein